MNNGELTAKIATRLATKFERHVEILFDHRKPKGNDANRIGVIRSWFGDKLSRKSLLADLDIAVVLRGSNNVLLLAEIEESSANPKTILGDVFATLFGEHFTFQGKRTLNVNENTKFVVLFHGLPRNNLVTYISKRLGDFGNLPFQVVIGAFCDETDLEDQLDRTIDTAIANYQSQIPND